MHAFLNGSRETSTEHGTVNDLIKHMDVILNEDVQDTRTFYKLTFVYPLGAIEI